MSNHTSCSLQESQGDVMSENSKTEKSANPWWNHTYD